MIRRSGRLRSKQKWVVKLLSVTVLLFICAISNAQKWPSEIWHDGRIVLIQGDTLKGLVKYDLDQDLVQYTGNDKTVEAFTARKILFFEIFDNSVKKYRQFFALPFNAAQANNYKSLVFFELLADGKLTLLCREAIELRTSTYGFYGGMYSRQVLVNKFYIMNDKGEISEFTGSRGDFLDMLGRQREIVEKYIHENRLKLEDKYDFASAVTYYNSL